MYYKIGGNNEVEESKRGIRVYDGTDHEYLITLNKLGELEITANDGSLRVYPRYSNQIILHTEI